MNFTLFVTTIVTGLAFVGVVWVLAKLLAPRSFNAQKEEAFECGIPTRGTAYMQFRVGYYLFAILFLMFDVETMFLFPWAVVMRSLGPAGLLSVVFFLFILILEERSVEMAIRTKRPKIKNIPYEEFKDNETYEKLVAELNANGVNVVVKTLDDLFDWGRSNSLWPLTFATSCCGIEFMAVCAARYDIARFGFEVTRNSPRQADVILVNGTITHKMAPVLKRLYDQMADPKYVVAIGGCAVAGGPFTKSYHVVKGVDKIIPVDVYVPGCPPRPESFLYGMMQLQRIVKAENFFGTTNRKQKDPQTLSESLESIREVVDKQQEA